MAKIIDMPRMHAGPFGRLALGDLGALRDWERIGDATRRSPPYRGRERLLLRNRSKQNVVIELESLGGRDGLLRPVRNADAPRSDGVPRLLLPRAQGSESAPRPGLRPAFGRSPAAEIAFDLVN